MILASLLLAATLHAGPERPVTAPLLNASPYSQTAGAIVAGDESALLVWSEGSSISAGATIAAARIGRNGERIDASPIAIVKGAYFGAAARGLDRWLVIFHQGDGTRGRFVRDDGTLGDPFYIAPASGSAPMLAFDGTRFLMTWVAFDGVYALPLEADGRAIGTPQLVLAATPTTLDLTPRAEGFSLVVASNRLDNTVELTDVRIDRDGQVSARRPLFVSTSPISNVRAIAHGDSVSAIWQESGRVLIFHEGVTRAATLDGPVGAVPVALVRVGGQIFAVIRDQVIRFQATDGTLRAMAGNGNAITSEAVTSFGDRIIVAYGGKLPGVPDVDDDLFTSVLDASFTHVVPDQRLTLDPSVQLAPAIARNAHGEALAVWVDHGISEFESLLRFRRVDAAGRPLREIEQSLYITTMADRPRVASDGENYLIVSGGALYRVSRDGVLTHERTPLETAINVVDHCATWNGQEYLVAYHYLTDPGPQGFAGEVRVAHVSREGAIGRIDTLSGKVLAGRLACASTDTTSLVAWNEGSRIEGALIGDGGTVSSPFTIGEGRTPAIAARSDRFAVATITWGAAPTVARAIVSENGTVAPVFEAPIAGSGDVAIAASRHGFVMSWGSTDLVALNLDANGHRIGELFPLSVTDTTERGVAIAGGDTPIAIYMRDIAPHLDPRWRLFTRTLTQGAPRLRAVRH